MMNNKITIPTGFRAREIAQVAVLAAVVFSVLAWTLPGFSQQAGQETFSSPQEAGTAFFDATQQQNEKALLDILGPDGKEIVSSGDPTEDLDAKVRFVNKYQEMHRYVSQGKGRVTLFVGAENWPLPIPIVSSHGVWFFDTVTGKDEILFRRIGKNELAAIDSCEELVDAQNSYFEHPRDGNPKQYAQRLVSDAGHHNGLYWDEAYNQFDSPVNPLIAFAYGNGPQESGGDKLPFNGYFFRILTSQGPHAAGGAKKYLVNGRMTSGFAFVAYPAEYRSSGVMTFLADQSGNIYEKDLGPDTKKLAEAMAAFDPDVTWRRSAADQKATDDAGT